MSTVHLSLDDYVFPDNKPHPAYELSYALGAPQLPSLYSHPSLEAQSSGSHHQARFNHHPADSTHPTYLPDHPEAFLTQYYAGMGGMGCTQFDGSAPPYAMAQRPSSPRTVYAANPAWGVPEGYGAPSDPTASSSSFLHNFQNAINASHTTHAQQQAADQAELAPPQPRAVSPTPWTLSGSLDPATGVFQRSVEHPRLRTAQACEKCRIRKAKCSGDHPTCQRCLSRGLQCEYAPERKMRGPNKQKRKSVSSQKHTDGSPDGDRRSSITSITSITSTVSSSSDASGFDGHAAAAAAATAAVNGSRPSSRASRASPHSGMQSSPLRTNAPRPRSSTIALGAIKRAAEYTPSSRLHMDQAASPHIRQRPPPIDLSGARQFPNGYPNMLAHYTRGGEPIGAYGPPAAPGFGGASEARRPSLPPYLLEAYSRIAFANPEAPPHHAAYHDPSPFAVGPPPPSAESSGMARLVADPYMHSSTYTPSRAMDMDLLAYLQSSPTDALSVYSNPRSNSSDVSAPITPLSLSDGESAYGGAPPDLSFSDYVAAFTHAGSAEPDAFPVVEELGEHSFPDVGMQAAFGGGMEDAFRPKSAPEALGAGWDVSMDDETPRAGGERKLSDIGRLMADVVLGAEAS